jgi:hypothetical protein
MAGTIPWRKTLGARLGTIALALLAASILLVLGNLYVLARIKQDNARVGPDLRQPDALLPDALLRPAHRRREDRRGRGRPGARSWNGPWRTWSNGSS